MGFLDRLMGRGKRTMGEATDSAQLREEGRHQEAAAAASERAAEHEERAQAEHERAGAERAEQERLDQ